MGIPVTCVETLDSTPPDNFSVDYLNYVRKRVQESPLSFDLNPFFPEFMSGTLIQEPIIYGNKEKWECLK